MIPAFVLSDFVRCLSAGRQDFINSACGDSVSSNFILFLKNGACNEVNIHNTLASFQINSKLLQNHHAQFKIIFLIAMWQ